MSENKTKQITERINIPQLTLWIIWFLLFLFPAILSIIGFTYFKDEYLYFSKTDLINSSFENLKKYNEFIVPEKFLEKQLELIKKIDTNQPLEKIKNNLEEILCCKTFICMFLDENNNRSETIKSPESAKISTNILKTSLIDYLKAATINSNKKEIKDTQSKIAARLQFLLKTITPVTISLDKVSINFSVINEGELFFILSKFEKPNNKYTSLFIVIKGKDFSFQKMLERLHKDFPETRIIFKEINLNKSLEEYTKSLNPSIYSGLKRDKNKLVIIAPTNLRTARHILHGGTDELNLKYNHLFPYIEYRIPLEKNIIHIKQIEKIINIIALLITLISFIYFLHISIFGLNPNWKFKSKILVLITISAVIPFSIFALGFYSTEIFNKYMSKITIQHHADIKLQIASQKLEQYLTEIETDLKKYSEKISSCLKPNLKIDEFSKQITQITDSIPISKILLFLKTVPDNLKTLLSEKNEDAIIIDIPDRLSKEVLLDEQSESIMSEIPRKLLLLAKEKENHSREAENYFFIGSQKVESKEINESLLNTGELKPIYHQEAVSWYSIHNLYKKDSEELLGIFCSKFEPRPILKLFFEKKYKSEKNIQSKDKDVFKEIKDDFEINYAFLPIESSGNAEIWSGSNDQILSLEDKELCLNNPQSRQLDLKNRTLITKVNQKVPHLAVAVIKELHNYNEKYFIIKTIISIILYILLIIYFTNKLLDSVFVEPVKLLAENANKIAKGSEDWETEINSGDEFEDLNNNFKNLVTGLKERNILKSYVSEDAFSDIKGNNETNLKPGGEYIEASIIFSAIKDYDKLSSQITPQDSIKLLSEFMSIAEKITKKYNGSIDKIIGDTIMLVFRNTPNLPSHGLRAAQASLELVDKIKEAGLPDLYTGIASGKVISGKIGSYSGKLDFTVIGNPVNLASRFKTESKKGTEQTGIIISGTTVGLSKGKAKVKYLRRVAIKGKSRMYNIYELLGIRD